MPIFWYLSQLLYKNNQDYIIKIYTYIYIYSIDSLYQHYNNYHVNVWYATDIHIIIYNDHTHHPLFSPSNRIWTNIALVVQLYKFICNYPLYDYEIYPWLIPQQGMCIHWYPLSISHPISYIKAPRPFRFCNRMAMDNYLDNGWIRLSWAYLFILFHKDRLSIQFNNGNTYYKLLCVYTNRFI